MSNYSLNSILFLDIETVPQYSTYSELPVSWQELWTRKASFLVKDKELESAESVYGKAGIYAEFGKIICISCGIMTGTGNEKRLVLKSFYGDDEKILLQDFCDMLIRWSADGNKYLCAHNGKEFDFPFLCRRMIINAIPIPAILNTAGKKPWEISHLDTMELWKFGDFKSYTSLNLLAHSLSVPTPKDDIDGSKVAAVYWIEKNLERIVTYCQKDVITVAQVFLRMNSRTLVRNENIEIK